MDIQIPLQQEKQINEQEALSRVKAVLQQRPQVIRSEPVASKVDLIQNQIQSVLNPTKTTITFPKINDELTTSQMQQYSLMNYFSEFYIQLVSEVISMAHDLKTSSKDYSAKIIGLIQEVIVLCDAYNLSIIDKVPSILIALHQSNFPIRMHVKVLCKHLIDKTNEFLTDVKFEISQQVALQILFNRNCVKFSQTDPLFLQKYQNKILRKKLGDLVLQAPPNIQHITDDLIQSILLQKLRKYYREPVNYDQEHWADVGDDDLKIKPEQQIINRFYKQRNLIRKQMEKIKSSPQNMDFFHEQAQHWDQSEKRQARDSAIKETVFSII